MPREHAPRTCTPYVMKNNPLSLYFIAREGLNKSPTIVDNVTS